MYLNDTQQSSLLVNKLANKKESKPITHKQGKGFTLIELIMVCGLSLLLVSLSGLSFLSIHKTHQAIDGLWHIQEEGRVLFQLMRNDAQLSLLKLNKGLLAFTSTLPHGLNKHPVLDSDALVIHTIHGNIAYYLSKQGQQYQLHRTNLSLSSHRPSAVLAHVRQMKILFAIYLQHRWQYLAAKNIIHWQQVKGVRVSVLLDSGSPFFHKPSHYFFQGKRHLAPSKNFFQPMVFFLS